MAVTLTGSSAISEDIYGLNFAGTEHLALARRIDLPVDRFGGDNVETYNWQLNSANQGANFYFENFPDCWIERFDYCTTGRDYSRPDELVERDRGIGAKTIISLPAMGWVANNASYDNQGNCTFPNTIYPGQDDYDPFHPAPRCGNGERNGAPVTDPPPDPTLAGRPAGPDFVRGWVESLVERHGTAAAGGVEIFALGNEPGLWFETHRGFQNGGVGYDELLERTSVLAEVVKDADHSALTLGPSEWGWINYFCSSLDTPAGDVNASCSEDRPDRAAHGGQDAMAWFLGQYQRLEEETGTRLLDYFDLHYYPVGYDEGADYELPTDVTRALWDPSFVDPSYIDTPIRLLPRMREWMWRNYGGTKLSLTEYNLGLGITDDLRLQNVIQADVLGLFGKHGLDLATFWAQPSAPVPEQAFLIYRDYDGKGSRFGTLSVPSQSTDGRHLEIHAARRGKRGVVTAVVINKSTARYEARLKLDDGKVVSGKAFRYAGGPIKAIGAVKPDGRGRLSMTYPARSVTLLELRVR